MSNPQEPPVLDWRNVIHKSVRTKDRIALGNVAAEDGDSITVSGPRSKFYKIPKSLVETYDGAEVRLSLKREDLVHYEA